MNLAGNKMPQRIVVLPSLPRNTDGKAAKVELRQLGLDPA